MVPTGFTVGSRPGTRWLLCCAGTELGTLGILSSFFFFFFFILFFLDTILVHELDRFPLLPSARLGILGIVPLPVILDLCI